MNTDIKPIEETDPEFADGLKWWCNLSKAERQVLNQAKSGKVGANELCPCGSGKKNKKCCRIM